jgi:ADP-ribose pyrophosphatase YjhB (NUDIX family)/nucleoside 2-deoxyribosyltransferase
MKIVYTMEELPSSITKSIFLAGPTPRTKEVRSWRPEALKMLELMGFDGVVFVPEMRPNENHHSNYGACYYDWNKQVKWEYDAMKMSDCVLFWVPRELGTMPAFTTNDEWGHLKGSGKVVFGAPEGAPKTRYQKHFADLFLVPSANTLAETTLNAINMVAEGALRTGGECNVPLMVWNTSAFQSWYKSHTDLGNHLKDARLLWSFRVGPERDIVFAYTLWVNIWVEAEQRCKKNEFVFSRTDISCVVLYRKPEAPQHLEDTEIVLVKEFRSPVRNSHGFVYENPGGSSFKVGQSPVQVASDEVFEETGLRLNTGRFACYAPRQVAATLSTHVAYLCAVELTEKEMAEAKESAKSKKMFGNIEDSEQTYLYVTTIKELMGTNLPVDWAMFGMIMRAVS